MAYPRTRAGEPLTDLRVARLARGLRLADVAAGADLCIATLSLIERGLRAASPDELVRIRRYLDRHGREVQRVA